MCDTVLPMRIKPFLLAASVAFTLSACGSTSASPAPVVTVTQVAPAPVLDTSGTDADYVQRIASVSPEMISTYGETSLIQVGHTTCDFFRAGNSVGDYSSIASDNGITTDESAVIAAAAILTFCPEQKSLLGFGS